jgi:hypothetical protein
MGSIITLLNLQGLKTAFKTLIKIRRDFMNTLKCDTGNGIMEISITDITPEYAKELLLSNTHNRNLKEKRVASYCNDMTTGKWKSNGIPIIIGDDGILKDGQHRLAACVKANVTLKNQIVVYLPKEEANCYDIGAARSTSDTMILGGIKDVALNSTTIIGGMTYLIKRSRHTDTPSKPEIIEEIQRNAEACEFTYKNIVTKVGRIKGIKRAGVAAAIICAYNSGYPFNLLTHFCEVLTSGIPKGQLDIGIIKLRDFLMPLKGGGRELQNDAYFRTQNVLKACQTGKILTISRPSSTEYYKYNMEDNNNE